MFLDIIRITAVAVCGVLGSKLFFLRTAAETRLIEGLAQIVGAFLLVVGACNLLICLRDAWTSPRDPEIE